MPRLPVFNIGALAIIGLTLAACGATGDNAESERSTSGGPASASADPGPVHVHGLGVNPADGALYIATHTGLYRAAPGSKEARRVGTSKQDTMGFSVQGADRFIGSGHPSPGESKPPQLGLIESNDAGRSWRNRSLFGEADFHILRAAGNTIYGFDASNERLLRSSDGGRTWGERSMPETLVDLVPNPSRPGEVIASTQNGLAISNDGAGRWRPLPTLGPGLLVWPRRGVPYHVDGSGQVSAGSKDGRSWRRRGRIPGTPAALAAASPTELYAALGDGTVLVSRDGGAKWTVRSRP